VIDIVRTTLLAGAKVAGSPACEAVKTQFRVPALDEVIVTGDVPVPEQSPDAVIVTGNDEEEVAEAVKSDL